jgi:metal-sulfur cluster biosynthetic enzyme
MKIQENLLEINESAVRGVLVKIKDPEIGENIIDLGLVYLIEVDESVIRIKMTMTSPACPMRELLLDEVYATLASAFPNAEIDIELLWEPAWSPEMMSDEAKANLGW